jgi:hypothetical protein
MRPSVPITAELQAFLKKAQAFAFWVVDGMDL